jgi:hemoglobin/transferrin/lactoferrin receptor protein
VRILTVFLFLIAIIPSLQAQTISIVNAKTGKPVEGVLVISDKNTAQSDLEGKVNLSAFTTDENLKFQHASFLKYNSTKQKIVNQGGIVLLIEDPVRLNEIVVSINRWEQSKTEIPNKIKTINAEDILHYNPQTTADLLGTKGGVFIQKSQMGGGSPMIRGFSANRVLLVVDGIRMNNAIYRSGNLQNVISLDANSIESTEIIFGPGSVIYGSDALGGVMSFTTVKPRLSTSAENATSGKIMARTASANFEKTIHTTFNYGTKEWAALLSTTFTDFNDLQMGSYGPAEYLRPEYVLHDGFDETDKIIQNKNPEIQKYTAYNQFNILGKLRFRPNESIEINLSANHSQTSGIPRYDRLIVYRNNALRYGDWYYGPQKWTLLSGQIQYKKDCTLFDKLSLLSGYQLYTESRHDRNINSIELQNRQEDLDVFSVNLDFGKTIDKQNEFFYGFETYINKINSTGFVRDLLTEERETIASRYPNNSDYGSVAGYISYKLNLKDRIILQAGSRYTHTWLNGTFDNRFYNFPFDGFNMKNAALIGNIGMVWHPTSEWQINVNASTGFRSPNIDDVAKVFDSEPGNVIVPNPNLKPEYARNIEIGIIRSYTSKARIEISGFYTRLKDAMVRRDFTLNGQDSIMYDGMLSQVEALVNADAADIYGGSFTFEYLSTTTIRTRNDLTITHGKDSDGYPVRHVPPTFGSSHLIYEKQKWFVDLFVDYSEKLDYEQLAPSEQEKPYMYATDENGHPYSPSWWTLNLETSYTLNKVFILSGGVENILDKRYRTYSSGIVSPGINFVFSVSARF